MVYIHGTVYPSTFTACACPVVLSLSLSSHGLVWHPALTRKTFGGTLVHHQGLNFPGIPHPALSFPRHQLPWN